MTTTPYDVYQSMLSKQAVDALVPGQVGMGINSGHQDSDAAEATQSALARNRADMQAMALISGSADAGAGYSNPPAATSPSLQMQADIKAAAVVDEAIKFAEYVYTETKKQAYDEDYGKVTMAPHGMREHAGAAAAKLRQVPTAYMNALKNVNGRGLQAAAVAGPIALAAGVAYAGHEMLGAGVPDEALKTAHAVLEALGLQAVQKQASISAEGPARTGMQGAGDRAELLARGAYGHLHAGAGKARDFAMAGGARAAEMAAAHPTAVRAGTVLGSAGVSAAATYQAMQMQAAQEQGAATPGDAELNAMKEASLNRAAQAGQVFALQQLGLA